MARKGVRKLQKKVNKFIRNENSLFEKDTLWQGRFVIRQIAANIKQFEDKSGWYGTFVLRIYDKKTGIYEDKIFNNYEISSWFMFSWINSFIIDIVKVWEENPSPRDANFIPERGYKNVPLRAEKRYGWEKRISGK